MNFYNGHCNCTSGKELKKIFLDYLLKKYRHTKKKKINDLTCVILKYIEKKTTYTNDCWVEQ